MATHFIPLGQLMLHLLRGWRCGRLCSRIPPHLCVTFWSRAAADTAEAATPAPRLHPQPVERSLLGRKWIDEYAYVETWGPALQQHLRQEQAHTAACLQGTAQLQKRLVAEMLTRQAEAGVRKDMLQGYLSWMQSMPCSRACTACALLRRSQLRRGWAPLCITH